MAESMKLLVKMLTGREIAVEVEKRGKVEDVKDYIYRNTGEAGRKANYNAILSGGETGSYGKFNIVSPKLALPIS